MTPRALMKSLGLDPAGLDALEKYNPDQPRMQAGNAAALFTRVFSVYFSRLGASKQWTAVFT
jgi:hypothetical protein